MKIRTIKIMHSVLIIFIILAVSCARYVKEQSVKSEGAKYNFVVASNSTFFKDSIHQKLIEKYKGLANIDLLDISKLKDIKTNDYNVILIMDTCIAASPSNQSLSSFINNTEDKRKIVLYVSANSATWKYSSSGIDAITSASRTENIESVYTGISKKIDQIISEK